jgi:hypothetical protein
LDSKPSNARRELYGQDDLITLPLGTVGLNNIAESYKKPLGENVTEKAFSTVADAVESNRETGTWTIDWSYFYEIWHATGEWSGGGHHLSADERGRRQTRQMYPDNEVAAKDR